MKIAFQGEIGAFSEEAARRLFEGAEPVPRPNFEDVFAAVTEGEVDAAVIPIENSLFGSVHVNYDLLRTHDVHITAELQMRIRHHLMARPGTRLEHISRVHSHPQALGQCQIFLRERLPHTDVIPAYDTAGAAKMVAGAGPGEAAIASEQAAAEYGLEIIATGIESNHQNYTRFLALAPAGAEPDRLLRDRPYKTSLVYSMKSNVPIDLFKIESRPLVGSPGNYLFYLDVEGAADDEPVLRALDHLGELASYLRVLGSYPRGNVE